MCDAHLLHLFAERLLDAGGEVLELLGFLLLLFLFGFVLQLAQIEIALGDRLQRLAFEFVQAAHDPFVYTVVEQHHFHALLAKYLQVRAVLRRSECVGGDVIDLVLPLLHAQRLFARTIA